MSVLKQLESHGMDVNVILTASGATKAAKCKDLINAALQSLC